jgi:CheY-like chemotaxis protein
MRSIIQAGQKAKFCLSGNHDGAWNGAMSEETILVVDDEVANLQKLQRTFVNRYPVLAATNGREALDLIRQNHGIAVIIADQRMESS